MNGPKQDKHVMSLCFDKNDSLDDILELMFQLNQFNKNRLPGGIKIKTTDTIRVSKKGQPGEMYKGTEFEERQVIEKEPCPLYIKREEVYSLLEKRTEQSKAKMIQEKLDSHYPKLTWGDELPMGNVIGLLVNEHLDDMNYVTLFK